MIQTCSLRLMLLITLFTLPFNQASSAFQNNVQITEWAEQILMDSLSASYLDKPSEIQAVSKYYSHAAWEPMNDFFNNELETIKLHKLTLHPVALSKPTLIEDNQCTNYRCWRVNQKFKIPELNMNVDFSLLIIPVTRPKADPLLIQSLDIKVQHY